MQRMTAEEARWGRAGVVQRVMEGSRGERVGEAQAISPYHHLSSHPL